jgi:hypothetical protein
MVKTSLSTITQPPVAQLNNDAGTNEHAIMQPPVARLSEYNFELPIKRLPWTHNIILIEKVKDIHARYWYMMQCVKSHWNKEYLKEV